jgi:hypothetical protein
VGDPLYVVGSKIQEQFTENLKKDLAIEMIQFFKIWSLFSNKNLLEKCVWIPDLELNVTI